MPPSAQAQQIGLLAAGSSQAAQAGLLIAMAPVLDAAWAQLDAADPAASMSRFMALMAAIVRRYGLASATLATRAYIADRIAAGVRTPFTPRPAALPPLPQIGATVGWATAPLTAPQPNVDLAKTQLEGSIGRLVQDVGRNTIISNVHADTKARGWARVPEPGCCSFCAMLATRGMAYRTEGTADFLSHNHCRCHAEPVFTAYEPSAQVREWQALYRDSTAGTSGADSVNAFRQAFEGHDVTDSPARRRAVARDAVPKVGSSGRTVHEIQSELAALEANLPTLTAAGPIAYHTKRIAELKKLLGT